MHSVLLDAAGHRRSPATMPGYHRGRSPRIRLREKPVGPAMREGVFDALHRRLAADAVHILVKQGRDMPLDEGLSEALIASPQPSGALAPRGTVQGDRVVPSQPPGSR
jgi:hypothetical protein